MPPTFFWMRDVSDHLPTLCQVCVESRVDMVWREGSLARVRCWGTGKVHAYDGELDVLSAATHTTSTALPVERGSMFHRWPIPTPVIFWTFCTNCQGLTENKLKRRMSCSRNQWNIVSSKCLKACFSILKGSRNSRVLFLACKGRVI